jgi:hypothetical protein
MTEKIIIKENIECIDDLPPLPFNDCSLSFYGNLSISMKNGNNETCDITVKFNEFIEIIFKHIEDNEIEISDELVDLYNDDIIKLLHNSRYLESYYNNNINKYLFFSNIKKLNELYNYLNEEEDRYILYKCLLKIHYLKKICDIFDYNHLNGVNNICRQKHGFNYIFENLLNYEYSYKIIFESSVITDMHNKNKELENKNDILSKKIDTLERNIKVYTDIINNLVMKLKDEGINI